LDIDRHERAEARASRASPYDELLKHDKVKLDIFWLKDDTLEDSADFSDPDVSVKIMRKKCKADSLPLQL
jgi:type I restriction enzyme M protein